MWNKTELKHLKSNYFKNIYIVAGYPAPEGLIHSVFSSGSYKMRQEEQKVISCESRLRQNVLVCNCSCWKQGDEEIGGS